MEDLQIKLVFETANDDYVVVTRLGDKPGWELVSKGNLPESVISFGDIIARAELDHYSRVKDRKRLEVVEGSIDPHTRVG